MKWFFHQTPSNYDDALRPIHDVHLNREINLENIINNNAIIIRTNKLAAACSRITCIKKCAYLLHRQWPKMIQHMSTMSSGVCFEWIKWRWKWRKTKGILLEIMRTARKVVIVVEVIGASINYFEIYAAWHDWWTFNNNQTTLSLFISIHTNKPGAHSHCSMW